MGMYTEFHFNSKLKKDISKEVVTKIEYFMEKLNCDSCYFDADTHNTFDIDDCSRNYKICIRTNLKNYNSEIEEFLEYVTPYLDKFENDFLGFIRYEEVNVPTLIFHPNKQITPDLSQQNIPPMY